MSTGRRYEKENPETGRFRDFDGYIFSMSGEQDTVIIQCFTGTCLEAFQQVIDGQTIPFFSLNIQDNMSAVHHQGAVAQIQSILHVMGNHQRGNLMLGNHIPGDFQHLFRCCRVKGCGMFIQ